jgi:hypothetical protein
VKILFFVAGVVVTWLAFTFFSKTEKENPARQLSPATAKETGPTGKQNTATDNVRVSSATGEHRRGRTLREHRRGRTLMFVVPAYSFFNRQRSVIL